MLLILYKKIDNISNYEIGFKPSNPDTEIVTEEDVHIIPCSNQQKNFIEKLRAELLLVNNLVFYDTNEY